MAVKMERERERERDQKPCCNIYVSQLVISIINSVKLNHSYDNLYLGVTFWGTQGIMFLRAQHLYSGVGNYGVILGCLKYYTFILHQ